MAYYKSENCVVAGQVRLEEDTNIWHYAVIRGDEDVIEVGAGSNVQDGAVLHVDEGTPLKIGKGVTIGHRAVVHGCIIEDDVLIGMGAIVLNGAKVGAGSIIGAGAVVLENMEIPPRSLLVGVPAKIRGTVSDEQLAGTRENAARYVALAQEYLEQVE